MKKAKKKVYHPVVGILGRRIKNIISNTPLIQKNVAHDANMDVENLRKYMRGDQEMRISTLIRLSQALKISASELLKDIEDELN